VGEDAKEGLREDGRINSIFLSERVMSSSTSGGGGGGGKKQKNRNKINVKGGGKFF
jgi:hypothetical protein